MQTLCNYFPIFITNTSPKGASLVNIYFDDMINDNYLKLFLKYLKP